MRANFELKKWVFRKWAILVLLILVLSSAGVTFAAPGLIDSLSSGVGYDPLSSAEQQRALTAALNANPAGVNAAAADRSEVLLVERHQEDKATYRQGVWTRRADVYIYHYDSDTLEHIVVNNETDAVDSREVLQNVQLPPTTNEIQTSIDAVFADPQLFAELGTWFTSLTGQQLASFDQIAAKAFIFHADSMGTASVGAAADCGVRRCVQLLIYTKDMIAFNKSPVVNLSAQRLVTVLHPGQ